MSVDTVRVNFVRTDMAKTDTMRACVGWSVARDFQRAACVRDSRSRLSQQPVFERRRGPLKISSCFFVGPVTTHQQEFDSRWGHRVKVDDDSASSSFLRENSAFSPVAVAGASGLSPEIVRTIRERRAGGARTVDLARDFGITTSFVSQICTGRAWAHAPGPLTRTRALLDEPLRDRIARHVDRSIVDGCWPWTGDRDRQGYGRVYFAGRTVIVHREILEETLARRLEHGEVARHRCDNPPCCNPAHLEPGTRADNNWDAILRGRNAVGERVGSARLSLNDVVRIRRLGSKPAANFEALGRRFGVTGKQIANIVRGQNWKAALDRRPAHAADRAPVSRARAVRP